jgi:CheY-like chemotaxis protein
MGMPAEVVARAVEPFFSTKGVGRGTGMGLSMAFGVMRQSGGTLLIDSRLGSGTTITLLLPLATMEPRRDVQDDAARDERIGLAGISIALVDDDAHVRASIAEMLRSAGATVEEASDGAAGVALVQTRRFGALVVDFAMPELSGSEVANQVTGIDPQLPVILITGFADSNKLDAIAAPNVIVLRKPFESHELLRKIRDVARR